MEALFELAMLGIIFAIAIVVLGVLTALPVMFLWNALIPSIFHLREISFLEAWGLVILCGSLFKSIPSQSSKNK